MSDEIDSIRTLIVDDDFRVAEIHAGFAGKVAGFEVSGVAHSIADALIAIRDTHPDLVLLDLYLPDGSGLDLMRRIVSMPSPPGVIVISAARDLEHIRSAIAQGAVHYLVKPFGFATFAERLNAFRDLHLRLKDLGARHAEADQQEVDSLFQLMRTGTIAAPPKGQSFETMKLVREFVRAAGADVSAAEVAQGLGVSRPTAQRYLSALAQQGSVELHLRYGTTGRPEHRYRATSSSD